MSKKPIFSATHPRACSSAFERVFLTRHDIEVFHEPFGDCYYHGKEMMGKRWMADATCSRTEINPEFDDITYKAVFESILNGTAEGKQVFLKDMAQYLVPPDKQPAQVAPSLVSYRRGVGTTNGINGATTNGDTTNGDTTNGDTTNGHEPNDAAAAKAHAYPYGTAPEPGNPTIIPDAILSKFRFAFLIRHPRSSIPSYYRCCVPPLSDKTGFPNFMPSEAGYAELAALFDHLRESGQIGPRIAQHVDAVTGTANGAANGHVNGDANGDEAALQDICVIDADDMLDDPEGMVRTYCRAVGIEYRPEMLRWDNERDQKRAVDMFEKWPGFHDDALESSCLKKREHKRKVKSDEQLFEEWKATYGEEGARVIQKTVAENVPYYEHLKSFAVKPHEPALPK